jgi:tRNA dimethylallyltransferase
VIALLFHFPEKLIYYGLEYKYITQYLLGEVRYEQMFSDLESAIHQFSKRQMTWFRKMEKQGYHLYWIDAMGPAEEMLDLAGQLIWDHLKLKGKK